MRPAEIDLNGDVGEGMAQDAELIPFLSSVNIACGGHAGDERTMSEAVQRGLESGAGIGAHPSFPDRENFGRQERVVSAGQVREWLEKQIGELLAIAASAGARVRHVKPHGALYNLAARDQALAIEVAAVIQSIDRSLLLVALAGSELETAGRDCGLRTVAEGFVDRAYLADGRLAPRGTAGSLIDHEATALEQALRLAKGQPIAALDGGWVSPRIETLCIHGDGPNAVVFAKRLRQRLAAEQIAVRAR